MKNDFVVAIFGPTGVGKSSLAISLAESIGEIISVDSMQVYKYLNIGTAKPGLSELQRVKHHLIDVITPNEQFTVGSFKRNAECIIEQIFERNNIPFLVGGTGLYFTSLLRGMVDIPKVDNKVKEYLVKKLDKIGQARMYGILERLDPEYSSKIHRNDKQRTLRALEVNISTKKRFSEYLKQKNINEKYNYIKIGINTDRKRLYEIINNRVDKMMQNGLIDEVKNILKLGYTKDDPGLKAIGYKEIIDYLDNKYSLEEAINKIKQNSRNYAKRQLVWFRGISDVKWFENTDKEQIKEYIKSINFA